MRNLTATIEELQQCQKYRATNLKARIAIENRLLANIAVYNGYNSDMEKISREEAMKQARKTIKQIEKGAEHPLSGFVLAVKMTSESLNETIADLEKNMKQLAGMLPVAEWVVHSDQRGFGQLSLAILIGETGDLSRYDGPAKVWKRMGLAPLQVRGKTQMGSSWRSDKHNKLSSTEWEEFGYNPRRRSICYVFGETLLKLNKSIYRQRYDAARTQANKTHPDWSKLHSHYHGMLLMTKLLIKNLWKEWNPQLVYAE